MSKILYECFWFLWNSRLGALVNWFDICRRYIWYFQVIFLDLVGLILLYTSFIFIIIIVFIILLSFANKWKYTHMYLCACEIFWFFWNLYSGKLSYTNLILQSDFYGFRYPSTFRFLLFTREMPQESFK